MLLRLVLEVKLMVKSALELGDRRKRSGTKHSTGYPFKRSGGF